MSPAVMAMGAVGVVGVMGGNPFVLAMG